MTLCTAVSDDAVACITRNSSRCSPALASAGSVLKMVSTATFACATPILLELRDTFPGTSRNTEQSFLPPKVLVQFTVVSGEEGAHGASAGVGLGLVAREALLLGLGDALGVVVDKGIDSGVYGGACLGVAGLAVAARSGRRPRGGKRVRLCEDVGLAVDRSGRRRDLVACTP